MSEIIVNYVTKFQLENLPPGNQSLRLIFMGNFCQAAGTACKANVWFIFLLDIKQQNLMNIKPAKVYL